MNRFINRILSLLLLTTLVFPTFPTPTVSGVETNEIVSGVCGETAVWSLEGETLIIGGTGEMYDYGYRQETNSWKYAPWSNYYYKHVIIEQGITHIGDGSFQYSSLEDVQIPDSVYSIGSWAFQSSQILYVFIPNSVKVFGYGAFAYCANLISLGAKNSGSNIEYDWDRIIPDYAFSYSLLTSIQFDETIEEIGEYAFSDCANLSQVIIPESVKIINYRAFGDCENLTSVIIEDGVRELKGDVFYNCINLEYVSIPESVIQIGDFSFSSCPKLISVGPEGSGSSIEYGWKESIIENAFTHILNLQEVYFPESMKYIGNRSFHSNYNIKTLTFPGNIEKIEYGAFEWCDGIEDIYFEGFKPIFIDPYAFPNKKINGFYPYGEPSWDKLPLNLRSSITWKPWKYGNLFDVKCEYSSNHIYVVGDQLDYDGLSVTAYYDSGYLEQISLNDLVIECDMSTSGYKEVLVNYKGMTSSFEIYVHEIENLSSDKSKYPESNHNYENDIYDEQNLIYPGAKTISITFSDETFVEPYYDFIYIKAIYPSGYSTSRFTGNELAGKTLEFETDNVSITLVSDENNSYYGYSIDKIVANRPIHILDLSARYLDKLKCIACGNEYGELMSIEISKLPDDLEYLEGESLDITGLEVLGIFNDETEVNLDITLDNINGFDSSNVEVGQVVTVTVDGKTATFKVDIIPIMLESIEIKKQPNKLSYFLGEELDLTGLEVTGAYNNGEKKFETVTLENISGFDSSEAEVGQVVTVTVDGKTATFKIDIIPIMLKSIEIKKQPNKLSYFLGEELDLTGLEVTGTYNNGEKKFETVTLDNISGFDSNKAEAGQVVTITIGSLTVKFEVDIVEKLSIQYRTHVQSYGWQQFVSDGTSSGTIGLAKRLEAIEIKIEGKDNLSVKYSTHVEKIGWQNYVSDGQLSGTEGRALRLEAIKIELTGLEADQYDIYYRAHAEKFGWLGWAKNGHAAGTAGYGYRLEAIEIKIVKKGDNPYPMNLSAYRDRNIVKNITYRTHVQSVGWQDFVSDGKMSGTEGRRLRLEGIEINLGKHLPSGSVEYSTHVQRIGWTDYVRDGMMSGTEGRALRLEAIRIHLKGEISKQYDIYYRVHSEKIGWMGWAKNGEEAGTSGYAYRLEGIEIMLIDKGGDAPGIRTDHYRVK